MLVWYLCRANSLRCKMYKNFVIVEDDVSKEGHEHEDLHAEQEVVLVGNIDLLISFLNIDIGNVDVLITFINIDVIDDEYFLILGDPKAPSSLVHVGPATLSGLRPVYTL